MVIDNEISRPAPTAERALLKTYFVRTLLVSLSGTALLGIAALLFGSFGELEGRILLTTLLVGAYSILCLGSLVLVGRKFAPVGVAGIAASSAALLIGATLIWSVHDLDGDTNLIEFAIRCFWVLGVAGVACTHASLLLNQRGRIGALTLATLASVAVVAVMVALPAVNIEIADGAYWRILGVFAILDVVGTIFVPLAARFGRR